MHPAVWGRSAYATVVAPLLGLVLSACPNQELAALEPCTVSGVNLDAAQDGVDEVDLLFMIDNSNSMAEEQAKLSSKLAQLVAVLTSGDREVGRAGAAEYEGRFFNPARSLHLGVISSDLGKPPSVAGTVGTCNAQGGDQGVLLHSTEKATNGITDKDTMRLLVPGDPACAVSVPTYINFGEGGSYGDAALAAAHFQCIAKLGVNGCGIEQQIAATYKALAPSVEQIFLGPDKGGQADRANAGFLRNGSVLAVVMVSDEDDCSVTDTSEGAGMFAGTGINTRCQTEYRDNPGTSALLSVRDLASRLVGLRGASPERFVFAGIVGLPTVASGVSYDDRAALLARPDMQVTVEDEEVKPVCFEEADPNAPLPAGARRGDAKPGRRFVQLANEISTLQGSVVLRSICDRDYTDALDQLIEKVAKQLKGTCLPRKLLVDETGRVACDVVEILPLNSTETCTAAGRTLAGDRTVAIDPAGSRPRIGCTLDQLKFDGQQPPAEAGWYYDASSADTKELCGGGQRVVVTKALPLRPGALARVECFQAQPRVVVGARGLAAINTPCEPGEGCASALDPGVQLSLPGEPMICETTTKSCQIPCAKNAECPDGWVCDGTSQRFCQNPSCSTGP